LPTPCLCCVSPLAHRRARQAGLALELVPRLGLERSAQRVEAERVLGEECSVEHAPGALALEREQLLHHALQQGDVTADAHLNEALGELRAAAEDPARLLGMLEAHEPALAQRIDADDAAAAPRSGGERGEHARVIAAGVLADHEDQVGLLEVGEAHRALADADHLAEPGAARLVTQVRAVGQVVGAVLAHEELVEERGLVARAARGVEDGFVRRAERAQRFADALEREVPRDRHEAVRPGSADHRLGEPAVRFELAVRQAPQRRQGVREEDLAPDALLRRLVGHGFRAVLAELDPPVLRRFGPRAAGAIEALRLVHAAQRRNRTREPGLPCVLRGAQDRADAAGRFVFALGHRAILLRLGGATESPTPSLPAPMPP
jgi:hypothetical protein